MSRAKIWEKMTVAEMRAALQETRTVLVPIGVTEQHGYHLTLDTDSQTAWQVCVRAAAQTGSLVAPTLTYGYSGGELPGTINIDYHVVGLLIGEIIRALAANGLQNIVLVMGHGGTEHNRATQEAAELFVRQHPEYADRNVAILRFWQDSELCRAAFDDGDFHAGYFETGLMMYWAPDDVRPGEPALDAPELVAMMRQDPDNYQSRTSNVDHPDVIRRVGQKPEIMVGVMGDPAQASAELGERVAREAVGKLVELVTALENG
jgi:creatinine amidohydrolase